MVPLENERVVQVQRRSSNHGGLARMIADLGEPSGLSLVTVWFRAARPVNVLAVQTLPA